MARKITRDKAGYELHKYKYICRKLRDGKNVSSTDMTFAASYAASRKEPWPPSSPTFVLAQSESATQTEPEALHVPLDGLTEEDTPEATNSSSASASPTESGSSSSSGGPKASSYGPTGETTTDDKTRASNEQARALGGIFIGYLRACNEELRKFEGAFVLPEVAFTGLIEPCVYATCERHAGSIEFGEREQTIVVVAAAGATAGQLFYRKRRAAQEADSSVMEQGPVVTEETKEKSPEAPASTAGKSNLRALVSAGMFKVTQ